jgi:hypothetical protein
VSPATRPQCPGNPPAIACRSYRSPLTADPQDLKDDLHELFVLGGAVAPVGGCLVWLRARRRSTGEGVIKVGGRQFGVARVALWVYQGGFDLFDTRLRIRRRTAGCIGAACCNWRHLELQ